MYTKQQVLKNLSTYMEAKLDELSINNSIVMVLRPMLQRASKKVICKVDKLLDFVADENGMIDVEAILTETGNNLIAASNKSYPDVFDGISIGNGKIAIDIPFIDKELVFTKEDIEELKNHLAR